MEIHDLASYALRQMDEADRMEDGKRKRQRQERAAELAHEALTQIKATALKVRDEGTGER